MRGGDPIDEAKISAASRVKPGAGACLWVRPDCIPAVSRTLRPGVLRKLLCRAVRRNESGLLDRRSER